LKFWLLVSLNLGAEIFPSGTLTGLGISSTIGNQVLEYPQLLGTSNHIIGYLDKYKGLRDSQELRQD